MSFVIAANQATLNLVRSLGCENTSLMCDTAIPASYFADSPRTFERRSGPLRLLWVGRMLTRKALPLALDALRAVTADTTLTIAGEGLPPDTVHQMIRDRNLQQRVFWKGGRLTFQELRTAYVEHDAMLFTSLRDSFGSQLLEALAMGLPVIALDLHGAHDFVPDDASLKVAVAKPHETVRNLASAIERYASFSSSRRNEMSMHAWSFAQTLSWSTRTEVIEKLYRAVLSRVAPLESITSNLFAAGINSD